MLSIYNQISDYIIILNYVGEIIFCNDSFLKRLNYNKDEILNSDMVKRFSKDNIIDDIKKEPTRKINKTLKFYSKSNQLVSVNSNISIQDFNNEKSIFIVGKEVQSKLYTMDMLEDLLDNINIGTFILDKDGRFLYINNVLANILKKTKEDAIGTYINCYWEDIICNQLMDNNNEIFKTRSAKIFNEKLSVGSNSDWYESYKAPIFDEKKRPKYIVATTKDISLAKTTSEELYKNYNVIPKNNLNENSVDLDKTLTNIGEQILEYTQADGMSILLYDEKKESLIPTIKLKSAKTYLKNIDSIKIKKDDINSDEYRNHINCIVKKDDISNLGTLDYNCIDGLGYSGNYIVELSNEIIGIIGLSYNKGNVPKFNCDEYMKYICNKVAMIIKNIKLLQEIARENKKRKHTEKELERYLKVSVDLVAIVGKDRYIKVLSPSWSKVLGWTEEELLSIPITDIAYPGELKGFKDSDDLDDIAGKIIRSIIRFRHKDGRYIYLEWSSEYLSEEEVYITTARDITKELEIENEKKRLEEAVQTEIVKNEFFSNISHEFRTPINIILGTMQVINKNIENNNIQLNNLKIYTTYIKQNSYRLLRLVNNLIDISKMDIGMYELSCSNENIINIIEDITLSVADYTKNNKIDLIFDTDMEEVTTYCDSDKIERIMLNLLSNAIKYTPENGLIKVKVSLIQNDIIVSVKDSGLGIQKDKLDLIFDRFGQADISFNRRCEGSGIGLSLVKNLVEMHGGRITVNSEVNKGSEFVFSIPIKIAENNDKKCDFYRKDKHVERCDIEFSDIYNM